MQTGYDFTEDGPFRKDYPNLFHRIRNLQDMIVSYCTRGELYMLLPYGTSSEDAPRIMRVSFEDLQAKRYELTMEKFVLRRLPRGGLELPIPKFSVTLELDIYCGRRDSCAFDFNIWHDKAALKNFCEELKRRHDEIRLGMID